MRNDSLGLFWEDRPVVKVKKEAPPKRSPPARIWEDPNYLPGLEEARAFNVQLFTDAELWQAAQARERLVFDIECYSNYFMIAFQSIVSRKVTYLEMHQGAVLDIPKLRWIMENFCLISFNGIHYDIPIASLALAGKSCAILKAATNQIIVEEMQPHQVLRGYKVKRLKCDHIDIKEVAPLDASLKSYSGRLHAPRMQDLPFAPETVLSGDQITITRYYCVNDLQNTALLYNCLEDQITLRENMSAEYGVDLRSKSDAQIAEAVIASKVGELNGCRPQAPVIAPGTVFRFYPPAFLRYSTPLMNSVLSLVAGTPFIASEAGNVGMPPELSSLKIHMGGSVYRMGIGGLHSSEKGTAHYSDEYVSLIDIDVESFYPRIILNLGLYPTHLGRNFLRVYLQLVELRLTAKHEAKEAKTLQKALASGEALLNGSAMMSAKDREKHYQIIADSLKIVINGSYGKLGSPYSILFAPDLLIQVTLTGQLVLLMLIERFELAGIPVVSANTDGIVTKCPKTLEPLLKQIIGQWESDTQFKMEETRYKALYSRDVNNYIAVKPDGTAKTKGAYANPWANSKNPEMKLHKNPTTTICVEAVEALLTHGTPIVTTLQACKDIRKFVSVRYVKGGAVKVRESETEYLGKSVRWYYGKDVPGEIIYAKTGNKVSRSDRAIPVMDLPSTFPEDLDLEWYIRETESILSAVGYL